jgi:hypothetical protein
MEDGVPDLGPEPRLVVPVLEEAEGRVAVAFNLGGVILDWGDILSYLLFGFLEAVVLLCVLWFFRG